MDNCPYCGYDISGIVKKDVEVVEIVISEKEAREKPNGFSPEIREAKLRSATFITHNWDLKNNRDLLSMFCRDCGKTPVELGFWERVDPYTLEVVNRNTGWMIECPGKVIKLNEAKEKRIERKCNSDKRLRKRR